MERCWKGWNMSLFQRWLAKFKKKLASLFVFDNVLTKTWKSSGSYFPFSVYQFLSFLFGWKSLQQDPEFFQVQEKGNDPFLTIWLIHKLWAENVLHSLWNKITSSFYKRCNLGSCNSLIPRVSCQSPAVRVVLPADRALLPAVSRDLWEHKRWRRVSPAVRPTRAVGADQNLSSLLGPHFWCAVRLTVSPTGGTVISFLCCQLF